MAELVPSKSMRVVSGIQPTGNLHLGNYLGAIRNWVRMQDEVSASGGQCLYFLADLHAISMPHVPADLGANTREMVAALAMGAVLWALQGLLTPYTHGTWIIRFAALSVLVGGGAGVYFIATLLLRAFTRDDLRLLRRKRAAPTESD